MSIIFINKISNLNSVLKMMGAANSPLEPQVKVILSLENTINSYDIKLNSVSSPLDFLQAIIPRIKKGAALKGIKGIVQTTLDNGTVSYGLTVLSRQRAYDVDALGILADEYNARGQEFGKTADPPSNIEPPHIHGFYTRDKNGIGFTRYVKSEDGVGFVPYSDTRK